MMTIAFILLLSCIVGIYLLLKHRNSVNTIIKCLLIIVFGIVSILSVGYILLTLLFVKAL